jgi:hypothetical protein
MVSPFTVSQIASSELLYVAVRLRNERSHFSFLVFTNDCEHVVKTI